MLEGCPGEVGAGPLLIAQLPELCTEVSLLPHFSWMIAVFLVTVAALTLIWALRRLGRETIEEKALAAQLAAGSLDKPACSRQNASNALANAAN